MGNYYNAAGETLYGGFGYAPVEKIPPSAPYRYSPARQVAPTAVTGAPSLASVYNRPGSYTLADDPTTQGIGFPSSAQDFAAMRQRIGSIEMTEECRTTASNAIDKLEAGGGTPAAWSSLTTEEGLILWNVNLGVCPDGCSPFPWLWVGIGGALFVGLLIYYRKRK